jgi:hypothetical protein
LLRFADPLALFQIIRQCLAAQFANLARHVCPSIFAEFGKTIDDHLLKLLLEALGQINKSDLTTTSSAGAGADLPLGERRRRGHPVDATMPQGGVCGGVFTGDANPD